MTDRKSKYVPLKKTPLVPVFRPQLPSTIEGVNRDYVAKCTYVDTIKEYPLVQDGKTTPYGKKIIAKQDEVLVLRDKLPKHLQRIAGMHGTVIETPATPEQSTVKNASDSAAYRPKENRVIIPTTSSSYPTLIGFNNRNFNHEIRHAYDRALGSLAPEKFSGEGGLSTEIGEHPLFADAFQRDLARIKDDPNRKWKLDLGHYFPEEKGGNHDSTFNNFTARGEVFAQLPFDKDLQKLYPNMFAVVEKFDKQMAALEKANPATIDPVTKKPDNEKYKAALTQYLKDLPKSPDAFLDKATTAKLAALPPHDGLFGTKKAYLEKNPDACEEYIKVSPEKTVPPETKSPAPSTPQQP